MLLFLPPTSSYSSISPPLETYIARYVCGNGRAFSSTPPAPSSDWDTSCANMEMMCLCNGCVEMERKEVRFTIANLAIVSFGLFFTRVEPNISHRTLIACKTTPIPYSVLNAFMCSVSHLEHLHLCAPFYYKAQCAVFTGGAMNVSLHNSR